MQNTANTSSCFKRTYKELKHSKIEGETVAGISFKRTYEELKLIGALFRILRDAGFKRTYEELKRCICVWKYMK